MKIEGGRSIPTTVVAHERPSGSGEDQQLSVDEVIEHSITSEAISPGEAARRREEQALLDSGAVMLGSDEALWLSSSRDGSEEGGNLASATLLLHQHTAFQVPATLEHLSNEQRAIYEELLKQWRRTRSEVD